MKDHQAFSSFFSPNLPNQTTNFISCPLPTLLPVNKKNKSDLCSEASKQKFHQDKSIYYYNLFFSPKEMAESIKRRNDNLQMLNFQNSEEEPDDIFNRRKKKVNDLITKEEEQLQILLSLKITDEGKFLAIIQFIKFFCELKEKITGIRTDYYSSKTFCALKNASQHQLNQLTRVVKKMYGNIMKQSHSKESYSEYTDSQTIKFDERVYEFLIIPRFLISKQKINRLCKDEILQKNFQFLVFHKSLGHYNNEANKKMPQETQMVHVRALLSQKIGREKFKKICSINHGNKFLKSYGKAYYQLYNKSSQYLKQLDILIKKGKKYENIKKQLQKIPSQTDQSFKNSFYTQNESSNSAYNLKNLDDCLQKLESSHDNSEMVSEMRDEPVEIDENSMKKGIIKLLNQPLSQLVEKEQPRGFAVKRYQSMNAKKTENIIIIPPPFNKQI